MLLCQMNAHNDACGWRRCEHLYFCIGVTLQLHLQTTSWQWHLHLTMLRFFLTIFVKSGGALQNSSDWNRLDLDGVGADSCWTTVLVFLIDCDAETKGDIGGDGLNDGSEEGEAGNATLPSRPITALGVFVSATCS